jgi:hypothetical protein
LIFELLIDSTDTTGLVSRPQIQDLSAKPASAFGGLQNALRLGRTPDNDVLGQVGNPSEIENHLTG